MYKRSIRISRILAVVCISVFTLTSVPLLNDSFAANRGGRGARFEHVDRRHETRAVRSQRHGRSRHRRHVISPRIVRHGHAVRRLPRGYRRTWYNRRPYFYRSGIFYRPDTAGFLAVRAPVGAIVVSLPIGYQRHWIDGRRYYAYGGTFYQRVPAGYVVVDPPPTVIVEDDTLEIVSPAIPASGRVIVDAPVLNVRSGPSLNDKMIYQLDEGYVLEVSGRSDGWLYVQLPNGEYGWVKSVFTKPLNPGNG